MASATDTLTLFDIDGTLLRAPDEVHLDAFEHALRAVFGVPAVVRGRPLAGRLDRVIAREALADCGISAADADRKLGAVVATMGRYYSLRVGAGDRESWVLPGVVELLRKLRAGGLAAAVVSGGAAPVAKAKLSAARLDEHLVAGAYGDQADERAELVALAVTAASEVLGRRHLAAHAVVIGDAPGDVAAARAAGARVIAVATGRFGIDELAELGPDAVFADLSNPDAVLRVIRQA
ncbi:MAG: HAD family hydrolase [Acidimicrobiales bacterium]